MVAHAGKALLLCVVLCLAACAQVPVTGRSQLSLIPQQQLISMSFQQYSAFKSENRGKIVTGTPEARMVQRVGVRIQRAVEAYMRQHRLESQLAGYKWEFNLADTEDVNAWAMPGGKVMVYRGLLPVTRDETGLAVVLGHEIGHAVANHGGERMSQQFATQLGGMALAAALREKSHTTQALWMTAFGLGSTVGVILPYSRLQENEADRLGLIFMAMAGYDPREALPFWKRMAQQGGGAKMPEFLSTHPTDAARMRNIQALMPEALRYYRK
jgi:predicted Zn-dependent protease